MLSKALKRRMISCDQRHLWTLDNFFPTTASPRNVGARAVVEKLRGWLDLLRRPSSIPGHTCACVSFTLDVLHTPGGGIDQRSFLIWRSSTTRLDASDAALASLTCMDRLAGVEERCVRYRQLFQASDDDADNEG